MYMMVRQWCARIQHKPNWGTMRLQWEWIIYKCDSVLAMFL